MKKQLSMSIFTKLLWYSLFLIFVLVPFKTNAESETVRADYQNILIVPPGTNFPVDKSTSATFFGGHIGEYAVPGTGNFLSESSFGQAFAKDIPYPGFDDAALEMAIKMLYEGDDAAFRYKKIMYEKDGENFIKAQFEDIMTYWGIDQRDRALDAADEIRSALRYAPLNRNLRWALLDIYYDIAVADLAAAREKMVKAFQASLGIGKVAPPGEFLISVEIEYLEEALPLYRKAIEEYFRLINDPMGVNVVDIDPDAADDVPFGYYIFMQEVPQRSLFSPLFKDTDDNKWKLPLDGEIGDEIFSGYKDLVLLFNVQRDYARAASQLARRYILRSAPAYSEEYSDYDKALKLIGNVQQTCYIEGNVVLGIFPDYADENNGADSDSGLLEAISSWHHELTELSHLRTYANGETNLLGFTDDFLVLVQSVIPGDPQTQYFDSYNYFAAYLNNAASGGPLYNALGDWNDAKKDYEKYRESSDQLAMQFHNKTEQYDERLRQIVGVNPGDAGYDTPFDNEGSEMYLQGLNIDIARKHIEANQQEIANLQEQVEIEVWRRGEEEGINDAIHQVYLDYGEYQANLTHEIANINAAQAFANNMAAAVASTSVSVGFPPSISVSTSGGTVAYSVNAVLQAWGEYEKGMRQATKERLAGKEKAEVLAYNDDLLDINSKAQIKTWLLRMNTLVIESAEYAIVLVQEIGRLTALINEKEDLERRKAETNELLADRYFADPSHRLLKDKSILRAEFSFQRAQKWMFFTVRALEYKWNQKFDYYYQTTEQTYTSDTLLALRNAGELEDMFDAMAEWDVKRAISGLNDDWYVKFSFREDFLGYRNGSQYFDPLSGEPVQPWEAFQSYLGQESFCLNPGDEGNELNVKALRLTFSTVTAKETLGFFSRNNWLDKIKYMRVRVIGASSTGLHSILQGYLKYGGTSFIRNMESGVQDPEHPDRYLNEMTCYSTRYWYWKNDVLGWQSKDALGTSIALEVSSDPDVPPTVKEIDVFKERSVATSEWTLYLPLEDENHKPVIDVSEITDIEIHFYYYWYHRN